MKFLSLVGFLGYLVAVNAECTFDGTILTSCKGIECPVGNYVVPAGTTSIGSRAFEQCSGLTSVDMSQTEIIRIEAQAFFVCAGLESVTFPSSLNSIGEGAFVATNLTSVTFPPSLNSIEGGAFDGCTNLISADCSQTNLTSIEEATFHKCTNLTSVTFPESLNSIEPAAFLGTGLTSVDLSQTQLDTIGDVAFLDCSQLASVTFPPSLNSIATGAFTGSGLTSVVYLGDKPASAPTCVDPCEEVQCAEDNTPDVCSSENTADPNCSTDDPATFINNQCCKCN